MPYIDQWVWMRVLLKQVLKKWAWGCQNHFVSLHLLTILASQCHISKLPFFAMISKSWIDVFLEVIPFQTKLSDILVTLDLRLWLRTVGLGSGLGIGTATSVRCADKMGWSQGQGPLPTWLWWKDTFCYCTVVSPLWYYCWKRLCCAW